MREGQGTAEVENMLECTDCAEPIIEGDECSRCHAPLCSNRAGYDGLCDLCREETEENWEDDFGA